MKHRLTHILGPLLTLLLFSAAVWVLYREIHHYPIRLIVHELHAIARRRAAGAIVLCAASYLLLTLYDALACRYIRQPLPYRRVALAAFVGYAFSHSMGAAFISGGSVRYRLYSEWGLSGWKVTVIVLFGGLTLGLGFLAAAGFAFLWHPMLVPPELHLGMLSLRPIGILLLAVVMLYIIACTVRRRPLRVRRWELPMPSPAIAIAQILLGVGDWILASSVFHELLPKHAAPSMVIISVFMVGQVAGLLSHVPGGLGVFETITLLFLSPLISPHRIFSALLAFRVIYYLIPLAVAAVMLIVHEIHLRRLLRQVT